MERELVRRKREGEEPFEYFAPTYIETKEVDGKLVNTKVSLFYIVLISSKWTFTENRSSSNVCMISFWVKPYNEISTNLY